MTTLIDNFASPLSSLDDTYYFYGQKDASTDGRFTRSVIFGQSLTSADSPEFTNLTLSGPATDRLTYFDVNGTLQDVENLAEWITGVTNRTTITDSGTGKVEIDISASYAGQATITTIGTITTGTWDATEIAVNKGGTGQTSYTDGQLLIGNNTGNTLTKSTLSATAGQGISVTNGAGSITLAGIDATTSVKGVASFSSSNFTVTSGAVNTIQNINISSTPQFRSVIAKQTVSSDVNFRMQPSGASGRAQYTLEDISGTQLWRCGLTGAGGTAYSFYDGVNNVISMERSGDLIVAPGGSVISQKTIAITGTDARLRLNDSVDATSYTDIDDASATQLRINKNTSSGGCIIDIGPLAEDGTSNSTLRVFRETNTTGTVGIQVCTGDNTATTNHFISGNSNSYFCVDNSNFGIGTDSPGSKLHVTGGAQIGSPTGGDQGSGTLNAEELYINGVAVSGGTGSSGSYTPTYGVTGGTITAVGEAFYQQVGSFVIVQHAFYFSPSGSSLGSIINFTIPVSSNFTSSTDVTGHGIVYESGNSGANHGIAVCNANTTFDRISVDFSVETSTSNDIYTHITAIYEVL